MSPRARTHRAHWPDTERRQLRRPAGRSHFLGASSLPSAASSTGAPITAHMPSRAAMAAARPRPRPFLVAQKHSARGAALGRGRSSRRRARRAPTGPAREARTCALHAAALQDRFEGPAARERGAEAPDKPAPDEVPKRAVQSLRPLFARPVQISFSVRTRVSATSGFFPVMNPRASSNNTTGLGFVTSMNMADSI